jgi:excisionase family DNA binding protein
MKEAMAYLQVSRSTMYRKMKRRELKGYKIGSEWRFYLKDLQAMLDSTEKGTEGHAESN